MPAELMQKLSGTRLGEWLTYAMMSTAWALSGPCYYGCVS